MINKTLSLFLITIIFALSSCNKEEGNIEEPTFDEILTSQLWVTESYVVKYGTADPDDENAPFESFTGQCLSKLLLSYLDDGIFEQYQHNECNNSIGNYDRWESESGGEFLRYYNSNFVNSKGYKVKSYSREEIVLYQEGMYIHGGGIFVTIITLVPFY